MINISRPWISSVTVPSHSFRTHPVSPSDCWSDLRHLIPQATPNALTRQLKELEEDGLISRTVIHDQPPKVVVYRLAVPELIPFLEALGSWCSEESEVCYGA